MINLIEIKNYLRIFRRDAENLKKEGGAFSHGKEELFDLFCEAITRATAAWLDTDGVSQMQAQKNVLALYGLVQLHKMLIEPKLGRNQSMLSYGRSLFTRSTGDAYFTILKQLHTKIENSLVKCDINAAQLSSDPDILAIKSAIADYDTQWPANLDTLQQRFLFVGTSYFLTNLLDTKTTKLRSTTFGAGVITVGAYTFSGILAFFTGFITVPVFFMGVKLSSMTSQASETVKKDLADHIGEWYTQTLTMLSDREAFKTHFAKLFDEPNLNVAEHTDIQHEADRLGLTIKYIEEKLPQKQYPQFYCPLSLAFMTDPVSLGNTGDNFQRDQIVAALSEKPGINPASNTAITHTKLTSNRDLRNTMLQSLQDVKQQFDRENKPKMKRCGSF